MDKSEKIKILEEAKVFDMKNGSATIHFDNDGKIRKVEYDYIGYLAPKPNPNLH